MVKEVLASAQKEGAETELVTLAEKTILPCDACESCRKTDKCHYNDDMQDIYHKLLEADGIIFGSPVFYWTLTAQAKALIDRTFVFSKEKKLKGKPVGVVAIGERLGLTDVFAAFTSFFYLQRMIPVGFAAGFGEKRGEVKDDSAVNIRGMKEAKALGNNMVRFIRSQKGYNWVVVPSKGEGGSES
jgi:multimeric flavodoxin WrbA